MGDQPKRAVRNLAILLLGAVPLAIVTVWVQSTVFPLEWMRRADGAGGGEPVSTFVFWFLVLALPALLGGLIHQAALRAIPPSWAPGRRRLAVLLSAPLVLLGFLLIGNAPDALVLPRVVAPILVSLAFYGLLARPLREPVPDPRPRS